MKKKISFMNEELYVLHLIRHSFFDIFPNANNNYYIIASELLTQLEAIIIKELKKDYKI